MSLSYKEQVIAYLDSISVGSVPRLSQVVEITSHTTLLEGFEVLINNHILSAPVFHSEEGEYIGFLDIRDLVSFVVFVYDQQLVTNDSRLVDLIVHGTGQFNTITTEGVTVSYLARRNRFHPVNETDSLLKVVEILSKGLHRVPVLGEDGRVVNIISQSTIISLISNQDFVDHVELSQLSVGTTPVKTVHYNTSVISTFRLLDQFKLSGVAIIDDEGKMVGVTTGKDLKYFLKNPSHKVLEMTIFENLKIIRSEDIDSRSLAISVLDHDTLKRAIHLIAATKVHRIFVIDDDKSFQPVRVLSITDILTYFVKGK